MLAVALVPLVIMTIACLLERLEARAVPGEGTRATRRAAAPKATTTATPVRAVQDAGRTGAVPDAAPTGRHLRLLPSLAGVTGTARATVASAADTLRRAS